MIEAVLSDQQKVDDAAAWLDVNHEGWADQIDTTDFRMDDTEKCIGGYLGIDWYFDLTKPFKRDMVRKGYSEADYEGIFADHDTLWIQAIEYRQDMS